MDRGWMDWWGGLLGVVRWELDMCNKSVGLEYTVEWMVLLDAGMIKKGMDCRIGF